MDINESFEEHADLINQIADIVHSSQAFAITYEDARQAACEGFIKAFAKFDDTKGASFKTYLNIRVRGAILDEVRRCNQFTKEVYRSKTDIRFIEYTAEHDLVTYDNVTEGFDQLIQTLEPKLQTILRLRLKYDLSVEEVGTIFGCGGSRISQLYTKAINQLRERH